MTVLPSDVMNEARLYLLVDSGSIAAELMAECSLCGAITVGRVLVIGMTFGFRLGLSAVGTYVALGALGLPVFAGTPAQGAGLPYMLGPTGGYLLGFLVAAAACGALAERGWDRRLATSLVAMLAGHALIFVCGIAWLATLVGLERAV